MKKDSLKSTIKAAKDDPLGFLTDVNDWLEKYPINIGAAFDNMVGKGQTLAQGKVDIICRWLAWKVNIAVERKRQELIKTLYEMFKNTAQGRVMKAATAIQKFASNPIGSLGALADALFGPVVKVIKWTYNLGKQLIRLAKNLALIANTLPPSPPSPEINYDEFKLKIGSISMAIITQDPSNMPSPEVLFPEPIRPWSPAAFQAEFEEVKKVQKTYYDVKDWIKGPTEISGGEDNTIA